MLHRLHTRSKDSQAIGPRWWAAPTGSAGRSKRDPNELTGHVETPDRELPGARDPGRTIRRPCVSAGAFAQPARRAPRHASARADRCGARRARNA